MLDVTARHLTISHSARTETRWKQLRFWEAESAAWRSATISAATSASSTKPSPTTAATSTAKSRTALSGTMVRTSPTRRTNTSSSSSATWSAAEFEEVQAEVVNYYKGHWIDHPAQSNLYQIPEPLRTQCLNSFLESRVGNPAEQPAPANYEEWIHRAFGRVFADTFPAVYTRKYWTREPADLGTDWIGKRVYYPKVEDVTAGAKGPLGRSTYWVNRWRYPSKGGFFTYTHKLAEGARIEYGKKLVFVNFQKRLLGFEDGTQANFETLVSTLPLPALIECAEDAPIDVREAASMLQATRLLLVRVAANHPSVRKEPWLYVYDEDKISTRVSIQENFSPHNAPAGKTALSVEVCGSDFNPLPTDRERDGRTGQAGADRDGSPRGTRRGALRRRSGTAPGDRSSTTTTGARPSTG